MDVSKWFNYYSFDVMGDLSFGKSFNMLVDGKDSYICRSYMVIWLSMGFLSI